MARPLRKPRLEVPGGIYYVTLWTVEGGLSLASPDDVALLEECIEWSLLHSGAQLFAYRWLPLSVHLLLKVSDCRLEWSGRCLELLIKRICGRYTQARNVRLGESGTLFRRPYTALLVDRARYLLNVVRYIHRYSDWAESDVDAGVDLRTYSVSSDPAYRGKGRLNCLTLAPVLERLEVTGADSHRAYEALMEGKETARVTSLIQDGSEYDPRIIGELLFIERTLVELAQFRPDVSRQQLVVAAAFEFQVVPEALFSPSDRVEAVVEARAFIAWQAVRNGMRPATIGRWLGNTWPNFLTTIGRHRPDNVELFDLPLEELVHMDTEGRAPRGIVRRDFR